MTSAALTIANLTTSFAQLDEVVAQLDDDGWATQSLCPDWTARGALTHVTAVEQVLDGWFPEGVDTPLPFDQIAAFGTEAAAWSNEELLARHREIVDRRSAQLAALDEAAFGTPSPTPVGPQTYGRFMAIRVFDVWVHVRDIARPAGIATDDGGPAAEMALAEVIGSMGYIAGKKIGVADGQSLLIELTGPVETTIPVAVDGRAKVVDSVDDPTATLRTDSATFTLLACGRIDPETEIAEGRVSWSGDHDLGRRAATSLRFTM
ncbi:MAG: maleylpyruvate isomerase family mycothiol-dependent enzyme [Acidimicrobiales bacterium]